MAALSLCSRLRLGPSWPDGQLVSVRGCRSVPGPTESRLPCRGRGDSAPFRLSASPVAALDLAQRVLLVKLQPVSRCRLRPSSLHASGMFLSSRSLCQARARSPKFPRRRLPYVQCPECCSETSIHFRAYTPLRLPLGHRLRMIHLSTTSRPPLRFWLLPLLPSTVRHFCLPMCRPVWWS